MNKNILFIFILCTIIFYCFSYNLENFWAWGYYPQQNIINIPSGSWHHNCVVKDLRGSTLWTSCKNNKGKYVNASFNLNRCSNNILKNVNGFLECEYY
jgi:hypothetical protein